MKLSVPRSWLLLIVFFLIALLYLHTEFSEPLLMIGQLPAAIMLLLVSGALLAFQSSTIRLLRAGLAAGGVAGLLSFPLMIPIWRYQDQLTRSRAEVIIKHLEVYRSQQGRYPDSLAQLAPTYLPEVPRTAQGLLKPPAFWYMPASSQASAYTLHYYPGAMVEATYSNISKTWHYDD